MDLRNRVPLLCFVEADQGAGLCSVQLQQEIVFKMHDQSVIQTNILKVPLK